MVAPGTPGVFVQCERSNAGHGPALPFRDQPFSSSNCTASPAADEAQTHRSN